MSAHVVVSVNVLAEVREFAKAFIIKTRERVELDFGLQLHRFGLHRLLRGQLPCYTAAAAKTCL
eukprot:757711-Pleurochrysis_carterae.AAC.1